MTPSPTRLYNTGAKGWVIHLSGGGWRFVGNQQKGDIDDASVGVNVGVGVGDGDGDGDGWTSDGIDYFGAPRLGADGRCYQGCDGILSDDPTMNPLFHTWNKGGLMLCHLLCFAIRALCPCADADAPCERGSRFSLG